MKCNYSDRGSYVGGEPGRANVSSSAPAPGVKFSIKNALALTQPIPDPMAQLVNQSCNWQLCLLASKSRRDEGLSGLEDPVEMAENPVEMALS